MMTKKNRQQCFHSFSSASYPCLRPVRDTAALNAYGTLSPKGTGFAYVNKKAKRLQRAILQEGVC
jgi:hypothetical protein